MQNQKSRFFKFISKRIINCRWNCNNTQSDYTVSYGDIQNNSHDSTGPRAVSSMICSSQDNSCGFDFTFNKTGLSKNISIYVSDEQLNENFLSSDEETFDSNKSAEITRRTSCSSFVNDQTRYDQEVTIQSEISLMSNYQTLHIDTISVNCENLHSTEINQESNITEKYSYPNNDALNNSVETSEEFFNSELQLVDSIIKDISFVSEMNSTHVVINDYQAKFVDDVSVSFADRINIIRDDNDEWVFVEVSNDGRRGFVPRSILITISYFKKQLMQHRLSICGSRVSLISTSIDV